MALTVEELQIKLGCDATEAQNILKQMDATVKAYTEKFQKYFQTKAGKVKPLDGVAKEIDKGVKEIESKMKKARKVLDLSEPAYKPSGKKYVGGDKNGRSSGNWREIVAAQNREFAKARPGGRPDSGLIGLGKNTLVELEAGLDKVQGITEATRHKFEQAAQAVRDFGNAYAKTVSEQGNDSPAGKKAEAAYLRAVYAADKYAQQLDRIVQKEAQTGNESEKSAPKVRALGDSIKDAFRASLLGRFLKQLGRTMMRMAAMKLIRGTIQAVKQGLEELAKTSASSSKAMNTVKAAGGSIKMALGAAVMPIVKALAPVFVNLAAAVSAAGNALARFFAVVTGQSTYTAVNFSGSLDNISESASGAGSAVKGMLADFDELNVLQKNSGGGGGSSGVEQSLSTAGDLAAVSELGTKIREAIERGDWNGVGVAVGEKLNESISNSLDGSTGKTLAKKISDFIKNAVDLAAGFLEGVNWIDLGRSIVENIAQFFKNVDYSGIASSIAEFLGAALGAVGGLLVGMLAQVVLDIVSGIESAFQKVKNYDSIGSFIIDGILGGILRGIDNIVTWIYNNVVVPFVNGFAKAFGADSLLKPSESVGKSILEGIAKPFKSIVTWLDEKIFTPLVNGIEEGAKAVWAWLETAVSNVGLFFDKVKAALGIGVEYVVAFFKTIVDTITAKADVIKLSAEKIVTNVKTAVLQKLKDLVDALNDGPVGKLLKAIGVDLTNASASLGKKIDESKKKSQQLDEAIQDAQATASKGFDIEANVNKEKVDKYKETLKKPWAQTVKVGTEGTKTATDNINAVAKAAKGVDKTFKPTVSTLGTVHARENLTMVKQAGDGVAKTFVTKSKTEGTVNSKNNITNVKTAAASINKTFTSKVRTDGTVNAKDNITKVKKAADGVNKTFTPKFKTAGTIDSKNNVAALKKVVDGTAKTFTTKFQTAGTVDSKNNISAVKKAADAVGKTFTTKIVTDGISTAKDNIGKVKTAADGVAKTFTARISTSGVDTATKAVKGFSDDLSGLSDVSVSVTATLNERALHDSLASALSGVSVDIKATTKDNQTINAGTVSTKLARNVPKEASGGLAYGMTSAIIGEYAGARSNPEVIAPLNKLQGILERSNTGGNKDTMTKDQANTMIGLLRELTKKETVVRPSVELGQVVDRSLKAYART